MTLLAAILNIFLNDYYYSLPLRRHVWGSWHFEQSSRSAADVSLLRSATDPGIRQKLFKYKNNNYEKITMSFNNTYLTCTKKTKQWISMQNCYLTCSLPWFSFERTLKCVVRYQYVKDAIYIFLRFVIRKQCVGE